VRRGRRMALGVVTDLRKAARGAPHTAWLVVLLAIPWMLVGTVRAEAQMTEVARLQRQLRDRPSDTGLLCQLGWAQFLARDSHAATALDHAIALLGEPTEPVTRARLAMCLYSRGRVYEVDDDVDRETQADDRRHALECYRRSLALRPSAAVENRLRDLEALDAVQWDEVGASDDEDVAIPPALVVLVDPSSTGQPAVIGGLVSPSEDGEVLMIDSDDGLWIALRAGDRWRAVSVHLLSPGGSLGEAVPLLSMAPGPPGEGPTFVLRTRIQFRFDEDDDVSEDVVTRQTVLVWLDRTGAPAIASVVNDEQEGPSADVVFGFDGRIRFERAVGRPRTPQARDALVETRAQ